MAQQLLPKCGAPAHSQPFVAAVTENILEESEPVFEITDMGVSWEGLSLG